jgi:hypothetical protein
MNLKKILKETLALAVVCYLCLGEGFPDVLPHLGFRSKLALAALSAALALGSVGASELKRMGYPITTPRAIIAFCLVSGPLLLAHELEMRIPEVWLYAAAPFLAFPLPIAYYLSRKDRGNADTPHAAHAS